MAGKKREEFRLVPGGVAGLKKNACKDRSGDGCLCGSVYETVHRDSKGKIAELFCYPNGHKKPIKRRKTR